MQKRYAQLADRLGQDEPTVEPVGDSLPTAPGSFTGPGSGKSFQLSRRWEYQRLDKTGHGQLLTEQELNRLGSDGWELAGVVTDYSGTHYYLKRGRGSAATG